MYICVAVFFDTKRESTSSRSRGGVSVKARTRRHCEGEACEAPEWCERHYLAFPTKSLGSEIDINGKLLYGGRFKPKDEVHHWDVVGCGIVMSALKKHMHHNCIYS